MGGGSWSSHSYVNYSKSTGMVDASLNVDKTVDKDGKIDFSVYSSSIKAATAHEVFKERGINQSLNPFNVKVRESRDSAEHPNSTPLAFILDVTGSMNVVSKYIAQFALPKLMQEVYARKPIADPQVMFQGVDDLEAGGHLQVSQFESDIRIAEQLQLLWLENNGGGNNYESYSLPWYFLANHTVIDSFEKRGKGGYAVSCGDELPNPHLRLSQMEKILGYRPQSGDKHVLTTEHILKDVRKKWNVFHVIAEEGSYARSNLSEVRSQWIELLGEGNVLSLPDYTKLAEVVISAIQIAEGANADEIAKSWGDKATAAVVKKATKNVTRIVEI